MKFGWCGPLREVDLIEEAGFDFIELPLTSFGIEDSESFAAAKTAVRNCRLSTAAFNLFFPKEIKIVGPEIDTVRIHKYLDHSSELLSAARSKIVVLGSGRSRNLPDGFERSRAEEQFLRLLDLAADVLEGRGVTLVIEPLNRKESNFINSIEEGVKLAREINRKEIQVLADFYHMDEEHEPLEMLKEHGAWLAHIHIADTGRKNPGTGTYDFDKFFGLLKEIGYDELVSIECKIDDLEQNTRFSRQFLRRYES